METFRKPDLNQPRYRVEAKQADSVNFYKALCKKVPGATALGINKTRAIIKEFNELIAQYIMENREGVELPESLGYMFVATCKSKPKDNIDYHKSKLYGVKVSHKNWETDGALGKIVYTNYNSKYKFKDSSMWGFKPARKFKRAVSKYYIENWKMYMELNRNEKVSALIQQMVKTRDARIKFAVDAMKTYNEFDFN